ncbi:BTAD domain-containing putative transcriptional regulator [Dactylosporangium sp. CS-047395]|uniref:BTAD domain-containing putative transcriptional regulator n=1 Tax=Dactylosporangium sp. CS-047395 TaxID=3239936 RepID=UPI003D8A4E52
MTADLEQVEAAVRTGRADEALRHLAGLPPDLPLPAALAWRLGRALHLRGEFDAADACYARAVPDSSSQAASAPGLSSQPASSAGSSAQAASAPGLSSQPASSAGSSAQAASVPGLSSQADWAQVLAGWASVRWATGDQPAARRLAADSVRIAEGCGDDQAIAAAYVAQALAAFSDGDRAGNEHAYARALAARRAGDLEQQLRIHCNVGSRLIEEGRYRAAVEELDEAVGLGAQTVHPTLLALALINRAEAWLGLCRLERARADADQAVSLWQRARSPLAAFGHTLTGRVHLARGAMHQATAAYQAALAVAEPEGNAQVLTEAHAGLARIRHADDPTAAARHLELAMPGAELAAGWVALCSGDPATARQHADTVRVRAGQRRDPAALAAALELAALADRSPQRTTSSALSPTPPASSSALSPSRRTGSSALLPAPRANSSQPERGSRASSSHVEAGGRSTSSQLKAGQGAPSSQLEAGQGAPSSQLEAGQGAPSSQLEAAQGAPSSQLEAAQGAPSSRLEAGGRAISNQFEAGGHSSSSHLHEGGRARWSQLEAGGRAGSSLLEAAVIWAELGNELALAVNAVLQARVKGDRLAEDIARERLLQLGVQGGAWHIAGPLAAIGTLPAAEVEVQVLGNFQVRLAGTAVPGSRWQSRKARDLLKVLAGLLGRPAARPALATALWPDVPAPIALRRLSVLISTVRGVLDPDRRYPTDRYLVTDPATVRINPEHVALDTLRFHDAARAVIAADAATAAYANSNANVRSRGGHSDGGGHNHSNSDGHGHSDDHDGGQEHDHEGGHSHNNDGGHDHNHSHGGSGGDELLAARLEAVLALYTGDFDDTGDIAGDWFERPRRVLAGLHREVMRRLAARCLQAAMVPGGATPGAISAGRAEAAVGWYRRLADDDRYDEPAHLGLVRALSAAGRHGEAARHYREYVSRMREIDVPPAAFPAAF